MSVNLGKDKFKIIKNTNSRKNLRGEKDPSDVQSVITSSKPINLSIPGIGSHFRSVKKDSRGITQESNYSGKFKPTKSVYSKKSEKAHIDDIRMFEQDLKRINGQAKLKMMQVYLQKPYHINNLKQIK